MSGPGSHSMIKKSETIPQQVELMSRSVHTESGLRPIPPAQESWEASAINIPSRPITLVHYQQILTAIQVITDGLTIGISFLAGNWL